MSTKPLEYHYKIDEYHLRNVINRQHYDYIINNCYHELCHKVAQELQHYKELWTLHDDPLTYNKILTIKLYPLSQDEYNKLKQAQYINQSPPFFTPPGGPGMQRRQFSSSRPAASSTGYTNSTRAPKNAKSVASLRRLPSGIMLQLEVPYNADFNATMKKSIPAKKRQWDNNDKCWYLAADQFDKLTHLLDTYFDETLLLDFPAQEVATDAWAKLGLLPNAPLQLVQAAYRALSMIHHPDHGGDPAKMQEINLAHKEILGELQEGDKS